MRRLWGRVADWADVSLMFRKVLLVLHVMLAGCQSGPVVVGPPSTLISGHIDHWRSAGRSCEGRDIRCAVLGHGPDVIMIIASIHGDEPAGTPLVMRLADELARQPALLEGRTVVLVPVVNPDGLESQRRGNASRVDLNRDFPDAHRVAMAEQPETRAMLRLLEQYQPLRIVSFHQPLRCIDWDGPAEELAEAMAATCDLPLRKLGPRGGSLGSYAGEQLGIAVVTVELPRAAHRWTDEVLWERYGRMLVAALHFGSDGHGSVWTTPTDLRE